METTSFKGLFGGLETPVRQEPCSTRVAAEGISVELQNATDGQALARVQRAAGDAVALLRVNLTDGDELFRVLVRELGYGGADERLRAFLRVLQKRIEASG